IAVEVGPDVAAIVVAEVRHDGAGGLSPAVLLDAPAEHIVFLIQAQQQRAAVGGALLSPGHLIIVVVDGGPGLAAGAERLLGAIAFGVVGVRVGAVGGHAVAGADGVAAAVAVAGQVIAIVGGAGARQLAQGVVAEAGRRAVDGFAGGAAGQIIGGGVV